MPHSVDGSYSELGSHILWEDDERVFRRGWRLDEAGRQCPALFAVSASEHPSRSSLARFRHEYELKHELDAPWAIRPLELVREAGRTTLVLEDPGGEPLEGLLGAPMEVGGFLRLGIAIAVALGRLHQRGLVHKDVKPVHILVDEATGAVHLTGFGIASRLARERQSPHSLETLAGTLAYMAPEQTGRMNRSVDSRSDLYALGVTLYQMLTGTLPFDAAEPMEWVHCHLARRPVPPAERLQEIPGVISAIVMKLLAKRAEDRYQTTAGVERDLRRCQSEWEAQHRVRDFPLGEHDTSDRLLIPEKLYGRESELEILLGAFDRVVEGGAPELVLISGYSGIGKSSVVNELQPVLVPPRALFASGKFDQYKRDIPYSTLAQAFQRLIRPLLTKSERELDKWRRDLRAALDQNGQLIIDLVPELKLVIGDQPPVPEVPAQDAQRRFQLVLHRFISVFARPEHPLALFLDDLQWLDTATLDLLENLLTHPDLRHLMLIGAYRDNEVTSSHPLIRKLEAIKGAGGRVRTITLGPLTQAHVAQLLADALCNEPERCAPLAQLVQERTAGNPFFALQFLSALAEEEMLTFDHESACWVWDLDRIRAKGYTDNVLDLMVGKFTRLPTQTQTALQQLACLGNVATITNLSTVLQTSDEQVNEALWESVRQGLVETRDGSYKFIHDRVQEAAYSLVPQASRAEAHLRIGRLLLAHTSAEKLDENVFDIVNHLNRGMSLITSQDERDQLADLNLIAGKRAKVSIAYASALTYLIAGAELLGDDGWSRQRDLRFELELARAECEFLTRDLEAADERLTALSNRTATAIERAAVACSHMDVCVNQKARAVTIALNYLRSVGMECSPHPTDDQVRHEYELIWTRLGSRSIEEVANLPLMNDPESLATVGVLNEVVPATVSSDLNLNALLICRAVNLSLERGNCDASCLAYIMLGKIASARFGDYRTAVKLGQVGLELVEGRGLKRFRRPVYFYYALWIARWVKHIRASSDLLRRSLEAANEVGDLMFAAYARLILNSNQLFAGDALSEVQGEVELGLAIAKKSRWSVGEASKLTQLALVRTLRGLSPQFGAFNNGDFEEIVFEQRLADEPGLALPTCWYWIRKLQARFLAGDYNEAMDASSKALVLLWTSSSLLEEVEYHFYSALARAALCDSLTADEVVQHLEALSKHQRQLDIWAANCPENFANRAALVGAEIARIENRQLEAMRLYEQAIRSSRTSGFVHNEAIAYERASAFYRAHGFEQFADTYLRNARACYAAWGADGKVRRLERLFPLLKQEQPLPGSASTITAPTEGLDLGTVIRVSQAVSGEMVLEKLLELVMRKAMELAGAERGLLIVPRAEALQIEAESKTNGSDGIVHLREASAEAAFPESIIRFVMRTHESVILDDASSDDSFSADPYILHYHARSVLCLPLLNQAKLTGILYLENNLAPRVFSPERATILRVLASQAAISLENTRLYRDLENREAKIRRLVDSNIVGIFIASRHGGEIIEANDAFLKMLGYDREDLAAGNLRWTDLTAPEWQTSTARGLEVIDATGFLLPYEKEYLRKDGSRVPVLLGGALLPGGDEGVGFVLDLTERKLAEEALNRARAELAFVSRVTTLSALTASITHEVNQPLAGITTNAESCLRMLAGDPPNIDGARATAQRTLRDANRANEVIKRLRALFARKRPATEPVELNDAAGEVLALSASELQRNRVILRTDFAEQLPPVRGDRVQLQQVILNLVANATDALSEIDDRPRNLVVTTARDGPSWVRLSVSDSGVGIDPQNVEKLFQSFFTTKSEGMGIGLSISRSIVESHEGRIWASANEGSGATFSFAIPCSSEPVPGLKTASADPASEAMAPPCPPEEIRA